MAQMLPPVEMSPMLCLTTAVSPAQGTVNLVALARQRSLKKFVLVTSIGTDDFFNVLNLFVLVL